MKNYIFRAMNCEFCLQGLTAAQNLELQELFQNLQALLSRFEANSDVCLLNKQPNSWCDVHPLTFAVLTDAYQAFVQTGGLYNPFLGNILASFGYNKSFELLQQSTDLLHTAKHQATTLPNCPLEFDNEQLRVRLTEPASIDLGGYAKGWATQLAFQHLLSSGSSQGLIDAGGDIIGWGNSWEIDIASPFKEHKIIASITTNGMCAIATSNTVYRRWCDTDQTVAHHIIDPRTLQVANSDLVQVSIVTDNLAQAEQFTKCLLILGLEAGTSWLKEHWPQLGYILVTNNGRIITKNRG